MRQTEIENMLKELDKRLRVLEKINNQSDSKETESQSVEKVVPCSEESFTHLKGVDNPQENYEQSVTSKGLPITKEGVVTTESGDGKSPVDKIKKIKHSKTMNKIENEYV